MSEVALPATANTLELLTQAKLQPSSGQRLNWNELPESSASLAAVNAALAHQGLTLLICPTTAAARRSARECSVFAPDELTVLHFPDWETLPYDAFSPHQDIISERLETMARLPQLEHGLVVVTLATCLQRTLQQVTWPAAASNWRRTDSRFKPAADHAG